MNVLREYDLLNLAVGDIVQHKAINTLMPSRWGVGIVIDVKQHTYYNVSHGVLPMYYVYFLNIGIKGPLFRTEIEKIV